MKDLGVFSKLFIYLTAPLWICLFLNCVFCVSAPLTDKPPKILFPTENKISNMELQLGKSIMGFPPGAVCSNMCVIFNWQEMDDFTNPPPAHLQASNTDWWWYKANSKSAGRPDNNCKFGFHINKPRLLMSSRLFCQQRGAHMVPGFRKLARHMEMQTFTRRCLSFLTWGHDRPAMCECVRVWNPHAVVRVVFFPVTAYCLISGHSPPSTWRWPLEGQLMSVMVKPIR